MPHGRDGRPSTSRHRGSQSAHKREISRTRVRLAGHEVALWQLRRAAGDYRALVEKAKVTDGCAWCLCTDPSPRLVIRHREGIYYLACWPGGGQTHVRSCEFYNTGGRWSGRSHYQPGALQEDDDGSASVSLSLPCASAPRTRQQQRAPQAVVRGLRGPGWGCSGCCTICGNART